MENPHFFVLVSSYLVHEGRDEDPEIKAKENCRENPKRTLIDSQVHQKKDHRI